MKALRPAVGQAMIGGLRRRPGRLFLVAFGVFFALTAAWSMSTPLGAAPDEPPHLVKAAATARGEINGTFGYLVEPMIQGLTEQPARFYSVPNAYAELAICYAAVVPTCLRPIPHSDLSVIAPTTAGHYNPVYYAAVGWPSLFFDGFHGMYLVRLMSALLNSLLLAGAFTIAAQWRRPALALAGLAVAVTPMVLFLGGVVNPNGIESSSAILAWTAALSLALEPRPELFKGWMAGLAVAVAVLANARPLGGEWTVAILAVSALVARRGAVRAVVRSRFTWGVCAVVAGPTAFGLLWTMTHGDNAKVPFVPGNAFWPAAHASLDLTPLYINTMIGIFGWLKLDSPQVTYMVWIGAVIALVVAACTLSRVRETIAVLGVVLGVVFIPVLAQAEQARNIGMVWQGRYLLAFAVGLPILAGMVVARRGEVVPERVQRRFAVGVVLMVGVGDFAAFAYTLRRYMVGLGGRSLLATGTWQPPGTWMLWVPLYAIALGVVVVLVVGLGLVESEVGEEGGGVVVGAGLGVGLVVGPGQGREAEARAESSVG